MHLWACPKLGRRKRGKQCIRCKVSLFCVALVASNQGSWYESFVYISRGCSLDLKCLWSNQMLQPLPVHTKMLCLHSAMAHVTLLEFIKAGQVFWESLAPAVCPLKSASQHHFTYQLDLPLETRRRTLSLKSIIGRSTPRTVHCSVSTGDEFRPWCRPGNHDILGQRWGP